MRVDLLTFRVRLRALVHLKLNPPEEELEKNPPTEGGFSLTKAALNVTLVVQKWLR